MKTIQYLIVFALLCVSCNSAILDYNDPNNYDTESYFTKPEQIEMAANAVYSGIYGHRMFGWYWSEIFDVLANEANPQTAAEAGIIPYWKYQFDANSNEILYYWRVLYRVILRANLTIYEAEKYVENNPADKDNVIVSQAMGQAYFLRGWSYFQLAFLWGRVPLRVTYDQTGNEDAPRANTVDEVWSVAESDFKIAKELLPISWDDANRGRATSGSATGYLGKLYLYNERYEEAEAEFAQMTQYTLVQGASEWSDMFSEVAAKKNGPESVFEIQFQYIPGVQGGASISQEPEGEGTKDRSTRAPMLYGWNDWNNWNFPTVRKADFVYPDEEGNPYVDPRARLTFYEKAGGIGAATWCTHCAEGPRAFDPGSEYSYYKKNLNKEYKVTEDNQKSSNNIVQMRYADIVLMRAECAIKGANPDVTKAIGFINQVRSRIGAFAYQNSYSPDEAFELLKRERQLELMGEQHRFNDLKRWGILKETLDVELTDRGDSPIDPKYYLFPIPQMELDNNTGFGEVSYNWN